MVFKMLPEGFDGPIQSSCLHAIRRHSNSWMLAQTKNGARKNPGSV